MRLRAAAFASTAVLVAGCALVMGLDGVEYGAGADASVDADRPDTATSDAPSDALVDAGSDASPCVQGCAVCGVGHTFCDDFDKGVPTGWTSVSTTRGFASVSDARATSSPFSYAMGSLDGATNSALVRSICPSHGVRASFDLFLASASATDEGTIVALQLPGFEFIRLAFTVPSAGVVSVFLSDYLTFGRKPVGTIAPGNWVHVSLEARSPTGVPGCADSGLDAALEAGTVTASVGGGPAETRTLSPGTANGTLDFGFASAGSWTVYIDNVVLDEL